MARRFMLGAALAALVSACAPGGPQALDGALMAELNQPPTRELIGGALRRGMPEEVRAEIRAIGPAIDAARTRPLYDAQPRMFDADDVSVTAELSYGPDPRHLLQVYTPKVSAGFGPADVIVLVHGGGFVGGDLRSFANPAIAFAGLGFVAVNITYPLAPDAQFPAGARAVGAAMTWTRDHAAEYGGDPDRVFVLGASAGATHVADYVFRPSLNPEGAAVAAGAVLYSPNFVANATAPSPYYGEDFASVATKLVPGNIERTSIPVLTTVNEFDPRPFQSSAATLYDELVNGHGVLTRLRQLEGHNHLSVQYAIGTSDQMFLEEVLDFVATAGEWGEAAPETAS